MGDFCYITLFLVDKIPKMCYTNFTFILLSYEKVHESGTNGEHKCRGRSALSC